MKTVESMNDRLKAARLSAGFRSATAAIEALNWPSSKYRAHENGQNNFKVEQAKIYADAYGVTAAWLLTGEGNQHLELFKDIRSVNKSRHSSNSALSGMGQISFNGYVGAGLWQEFSSENENIQNFPKNNPSSKTGGNDDLFDLYVVDDSISDIAERGEFLRCHKISSNDISDGDIVVIRRQNKQLSQIIIKRCVEQSDTLSLIDLKSRPETIGDEIKTKLEPIYRNNNEIIGRVSSKYKPIR